MYTIRPERKEDFRAVENLIRESFWNVYRPGCSEHYVMHVLRDDPAFVKELDFVMEQDGRLIGQNMFMKTVIKADTGEDVPVLTMGPICITPEPYCSKATSASTANAVSTMPVSSASDITISPKGRMTRSSCAGNSGQVTSGG